MDLVAWEVVTLSSLSPPQNSTCCLKWMMMQGLAFMLQHVAGEWWHSLTHRRTDIQTRYMCTDCAVGIYWLTLHTVDALCGVTPCGYFI